MLLFKCSNNPCPVLIPRQPIVATMLRLTCLTLTERCQMPDESCFTHFCKGANSS